MPRRQMIDAVLTRLLAEVSALDSQTRLDQRYQKFRNMGRVGLEFIEGN